MLYPTFLTATQGFALSMLTVLALRQVLTAYIPDGLMAKWPNDLYYRDQKLGGILIENRIVHRHLSASIIGIGLNVNQIHFEEAKPTSLALICGRKFQLAPLLTKFLETLEEGYNALQRHGWAPLQATYLRYLYWRAEVHTFDYQGQRFQGTIQGIDALGRLEIVCLDGTTRCYSMQEVRFVA